VGAPDSPIPDRAGGAECWGKSSESVVEEALVEPGEASARPEASAFFVLSCCLKIFSASGNLSAQQREERGEEGEVDGREGEARDGRTE